MNLIKMSENRVWIALTLAAIVWVVGWEIARADVGDIEICAAQQGLTTHDAPNGANGRVAQTFTTTTGFTLSGIKLPYQHDGTPSGTVRIDITTTSGGFPDLTSIIATETVSQSIFPAAAGGASDQTVTCNTVNGNPGGTVIEFTTPPTLSAGVQYAVVVYGSAGSQWGILPMSAGGSTLGLTGQSWTCNESIFNCNNPGSPDWDEVYGQDQSSGLVLFNTVVTPTEHNFDTWVDNFLSSIGMNSPVGKLLVGALFGGILFFIMSAWKIPWIISLAVAGMAGTTLTAAAVFDPAILLTLVAIIGLGMIGLIFALFAGGGNRDGG